MTLDTLLDPQTAKCRNSLIATFLNFSPFSPMYNALDVKHQYFRIISYNRTVLPTVFN